MYTENIYLLNNYENSIFNKKEIINILENIFNLDMKEKMKIYNIYNNISIINENKNEFRIFYIYENDKYYNFYSNNKTLKEMNNKQIELFNKFFNERFLFKLYESIKKSIKYEKYFRYNYNKLYLIFKTYEIYFNKDLNYLY